MKLKGLNCNVHEFYILYVGLTIILVWPYVALTVNTNSENMLIII